MLPPDSSARPAPMALRDVTWRGERVSRLVLGVVPLGMNYGVAHAQGKPDVAGAAAVVEAAWAGGIRHFDTAQAYGDSEAVLGRILADLGITHECRVLSRLAAELDPLDVTAIENAIERTFLSLGVDRLWCVMLQGPSCLDWWEEGAGALLRRYREAGLIRHLGIAVSSPRDADRCVGHPDVDILQAPCNAWDRRLAERGTLGRLVAHGQLCCVGSVYLQGLLTMPPRQVKVHLPALREASYRWHAIAEAYGMTATEMAMRYGLALGMPLVVGAESPSQLRYTLELARLDPLPGGVVRSLGEVLAPVLGEDMLDPGRWQLG